MEFFECSALINFKMKSISEFYGFTSFFYFSLGKTEQIEILQSKPFHRMCTWNSSIYWIKKFEAFKSYGISVGYVFPMLVQTNLNYLIGSNLYLKSPNQLISSHYSESKNGRNHQRIRNSLCTSLLFTFNSFFPCKKQCFQLPEQCMYEM